MGTFACVRAYCNAELSEVSVALLRPLLQWLGEAGTHRCYHHHHDGQLPHQPGAAAGPEGGAAALWPQTWLYSHSSPAQHSRSEPDAEVWEGGGPRAEYLWEEGPLEEMMALMCLPICLRGPASLFL